MRKKEYLICKTEDGEFDVFQKRSFIFFYRWEYLITLESTEELMAYVKTIPRPAVVNFEY